MEVDVVVIGSGASGLTTAVVAANEGLKVLVVEKGELFGGTTAISQGAPWIVANPRQRELGIDDDAAAGETYLRSVLGNLYDPEKVQAYIASGAEMVEYMESKTHVRWKGVPMPDYLPEHEGFRYGRTMLVEAFDGSVLGAYLPQMRVPLPGFVAFGSMQVDMLEVDRFKQTFKSFGNFVFTAGRVLRYGLDVLRFGRGAYLANGNALIGRLLRSALDAKVELWRASPAVGLITEDGAVTGVTVERDRQRIAIRARRGVVLASGGFGANEELREKFIPSADVHISVQPEENVGDGIRLGQEAGGVLGEVNPQNGVWAPVSLFRRKDGKVLKYPHFGLDRGKPGSIIVDETGTRFANEAATYQDFVKVMHERSVKHAFFIANREFLRKYGMGLALPAPYPLGDLISQGYLVEGVTLADLAAKIGIPAATLEQTVARFNADAAKGEDPEFRRGASAYDPSQGDFAHQPNPNLAPVGEGPYYAITMYPGDVSTVLGMKTDADARVLGADGQPIKGLFAVGLDQNTVFRGVYPGGGSGIGPGMTFGYRAARRLSADATAA
jgi:succinate dehydrogenase/fumarate reductase flavoprotein subunit